ncbi:uncharacterized protein LOC112044134 [Bicyclus anynana]|uniref:Uncharacterized protein LOC112044134 n=1 Tax=Bicyclus anynana TaxID=110368 RepID=A0A6J1MJM4_BICAN|nr:uncharacterized protein LOC112044134 [Bicyclus anynana]
MDENVSVASPAPSIIVGSELHSQIIEEGPRICPLCSSEVKLFFIHLNEKLLMCENTECDFPFGYEELQFVKVKEGEEMSDCVSVRSSKQLSPTNSIISTTCLSDIERLNREAEDSQSESKMENLQTKIKKKSYKKVQSSRDNEKQIKKNLQDLKGLSVELNSMTTTRNLIKNEKWIKNLMHLQDQSGCKLLQPEELKNYTTSKPEELKHELKIDIAPGSSGCVPSIKIEIAKGQCPSQSHAGT